MTEATMMRTLALVVVAMCEAKQMPSGHLYAQLLGYASAQNTQITMAEYSQALGHLKMCKLITERDDHMLIWIEPEAGSKPAAMVALIKQTISEAVQLAGSAT